MSTLMECGHSANTTTEDGKPVCAICYGIIPGATTPVKPKELPSLEGRQAKCGYDNPNNPHRDSRIPSNYSLAYFAYKPDQEYDEYYCGCFGWN